MALMFSATPRIKKAVTLINELEIQKFVKLLSRIIQKIHVKDERAFNKEEEEKLENALGCTASDLELILETIEFFFQQAAYHTAKPTVLSQQLLHIDILEDKVQAVVEAWTNCARDVVSQFRQRSIAPNQNSTCIVMNVMRGSRHQTHIIPVSAVQLSAVNWRLNIQIAQSSSTKMKMPNAMFDLLLKNENSQKNENVQMEFTHKELFEFYNQLETVQKQLDGLS